MLLRAVASGMDAAALHDSLFSFYHGLKAGFPQSLVFIVQFSFLHSKMISRFPKPFRDVCLSASSIVVQSYKVKGFYTVEALCS